MLWSTPELGQEWTEVQVVDPAGIHHAHGINIVNGEVVHRWSVFRNRPATESINV
jgi:hypothetical protein